MRRERVQAAPERRSCHRCAEGLFSGCRPLEWPDVAGGARHLVSERTHGTGRSSRLRTRRRAAHLQAACDHDRFRFVGDTRALVLTIIGTGLASLAAITIVVAVLSMQIAGVNTRIDDIRTDIRDLRADHVRFDERLDAVDVAFGKVDQRLETLERVSCHPANPLTSDGRPVNDPVPRGQLARS